MKGIGSCRRSCREVCCFLFLAQTSRLFFRSNRYQHVIVAQAFAQTAKPQPASLHAVDGTTLKSMLKNASNTSRDFWTSTSWLFYGSAARRALTFRRTSTFSRISTPRGRHSGRPQSLYFRSHGRYVQLGIESAKVHHDDTIYALSTAPGRAGIAIVRISGPACLEV